jgi:hypothetical protein
MPTIYNHYKNTIQGVDHKIMELNLLYTNNTCHRFGRYSPDIYTFHKRPKPKLKDDLSQLCGMVTCII